MQNLDMDSKEICKPGETVQAIPERSYKSLMKRYKDQPTTEIFAHFGWNKEDESWETPYEKLAAMTKDDEDWDFRSEQFKNPKERFPILLNYLNYTFLRAQELNLITYSVDKNRACFNTGLQTNEPKDIYAVFFRNKNASGRNQPEWNLYLFALYRTKIDL